MNARKLYLALGQIDDELILAAEGQPAGKKKRISNVWMMAAAAACICLVCLGAFRQFFGTSVIWNETPGISDLKPFIPADSVLRTMTWEEMTDYYQIDEPPAALADDLRLTGPSLFSVYVDQSGEVVYDRNQLWYESTDGGRFLCVSLARSSPSRPEREPVEYSHIHGVSVLLTVSGGGSSRAAQWEQSGTTVFVTGNGIDEAEFVAILEELLLN